VSAGRTDRVRHIRRPQATREAPQRANLVYALGCGNGNIAARIVPVGAVVGVDPSADMIAFVSSHFAASGSAKLGFEVGDARSLSPVSGREPRGGTILSRMRCTAGGPLFELWREGSGWKQVLR